MKKWTVGSFYVAIKRSFKNKGWNIRRSMKTLIKDPTFLECASLKPSNRNIISSYYGIIFTDYPDIENLYSYQSDYPGILFMDAVTLNYWEDKCKMNTLFNDNPELKRYKADWKAYSKKYDPSLAQRIHQDIPSDIYVIKPIKEFLGTGVIVVEYENLDNTLQLILNPQKSLKYNSDKGYCYWRKNNDDAFLIEKYYKSDYLHFHHKLSEINDSPILDHEGEYQYDATIRIFFVLKYDHGVMSYHPFGGHWKLPCKAINESGNLNEKHISCCKLPFYREVNPELLQQINKHLECAMLLLYKVMLDKVANISIKQ